MELFCDNEGAVALTKEPRDHGKSRHIDGKYHYIRHRVEEGHLLVKRVSSEDNPADLLTKALSRIKHNQHARSIRLKDDISFRTVSRKLRLIRSKVHLGCPHSWRISVELSKEKD
ncbi:hypothetical protein L2E82_10400 [Cichorium intybus]|uniref:Uncharacterized protein n=1 Tax=Cichorium intybus TaxID=13427 RepID=A0ACB9GA95_CICIN|nr:hypothetical protein L2E82_10400 [Cichorium intybus]